MHRLRPITLQKSTRKKYRCRNDRTGFASNFEAIAFSGLQSVIKQIDGYNVVYDSETTDHERPINEFGGLTWEFDQEKTFSEYDLGTCLNILTETLKIHLPDPSLGRRLFGCSISAVSCCFCIMHLCITSCCYVL